MIRPDTQALATMLAQVLAACPTVVVGPILWVPSDVEEDGRAHYFMIAAGVQGTDEFRITKFDFSPSKADPELNEIRAQVMGLIAILEPARVMVDTDDEMVFARYCEALFPCERSRDIRKAVEAERGRLQ